MIGLLHVCAHLSAALILMLLLESGVELCVRHKLLTTSGYHTLYEWYRQVEGEHFPDPTGLRARLEQWTFGLFPACIKCLMSAFDIPEVVAVTTSNICKKGIESLSRGGAAIYHASIFLYFWVFSTLSYLWCSGATCTFASTGFTYILTKPSPSSASPITSRLLASISTAMVILKYTPLQLTRYQRNGSWIQNGTWSLDSRNR